MAAGTARARISGSSANSRETKRPKAAAVARYLHDGGLPHVVAPVRSNANSLTAQAGGFSFTVYLFIEGRTGIEAYDVIERLHDNENVGRTGGVRDQADARGTQSAPEGTTSTQKRYVAPTST